MSYSKTLMLISILLTTLACGRSRGELEGKWVSDCNKGYFGGSFRKSLIHNPASEADSFTIRVEEFSDGNCRSPLQEVDLVGTLTNDPEKGTLDITYRQALLTPRTEAAAVAARSRTGCNAEAAAKDAPLDITSCEEISADTGTTVYSIYKTERSETGDWQLYLGKWTNLKSGDTPEARHDEFDVAVPFLLEP